MATHDEIFMQTITERDWEVRAVFIQSMCAPDRRRFEYVFLFFIPTYHLEKYDTSVNRFNGRLHNSVFDHYEIQFCVSFSLDDFYCGGFCYDTKSLTSRVFPTTRAHLIHHFNHFLFLFHSRTRYHSITLSD